MENKNDDLNNILFDLYDIRSVLSREAKNTPKDSDSGFTVGDCLDDAIEYLETIGA
jgi:hypothetical protein